MPVGIRNIMIAIKRGPKFILFFAKLKGEGRSSLEGGSIVLSSKLSVTYGGNSYSL